MTDQNTIDARTKIIYFQSAQTQHAPVSHKQYVEAQLQCDIKQCEPGQLLPQIIAEHPDFIYFDSTMICNQEISAQEVVGMIDTINKLKSTNTKIKIGIVINNQCTVEMVQELKDAGISGVIPTMLDFGVDANFAANKNMITEGESWPEDIINQLPCSTEFSDQLPLMIYFNEDWKKQPPSYWDQVKQSIPCRLMLCDSWKTLSTVIVENPTIILSHVNMLRKHSASIQEFVNMVDTMIKFVPNSKKIPLAVAIDKSCTVEFVKELRDAEIAGFLPLAMDFGEDIATKAAQELLTNKSYWPKTIIDQLPRTIKSTRNNKAGVTLTNRQSQVLKLVCSRGLSNKKIASALKISESTVKIHVSAILRKYSVRNRTQLALAAAPHLK